MDGITLKQIEDLFDRKFDEKFEKSFKQKFSNTIPTIIKDFDLKIERKFDEMMKYVTKEFNLKIDYKIDEMMRYVVSTFNEMDLVTREELRTQLDEKTDRSIGIITEDFQSLVENIGQFTDGTHEEFSKFKKETEEKMENMDMRMAGKANRLDLKPDCFK